MFFIYLNLFKVCVFVCVCMYVYMCVCVCVDRIRNFSLLDLLPISSLFFLRVSRGSWLLRLISLSEVSIFFSARLFETFSCCLCYGHWMCVTPIPKAKLIESSYLSCTGVDSWWGKCSPTNQ